MSRVIGRKVGTPNNQSPTPAIVISRPTSSSPSTPPKSAIINASQYTLTPSIPHSNNNNDDDDDQNQLTPRGGSYSPTRSEFDRHLLDIPSGIQLASPFLERSRSPLFGNNANYHHNHHNRTEESDPNGIDLPSPLKMMKMELNGKSDDHVEEAEEEEEEAIDDEEEEEEEVQDKIDALERTFQVEELSASEVEQDSDDVIQEQEQEQDRITTKELNCPICEEQMISLNQLNQHIDDIHLNPTVAARFQSSPPSPSPSKNSNNSIKKTNSGLFTSPLVENVDLNMILKKTAEYRNKIQTALPKQFASKFDLFTDQIINSAATSINSNNNGSSLQLSSPQPEQREIQVTRAHWERQTSRSHCTTPGCHRLLNLKNGVIHCRHCGKLHCHEHTTYRAKLNQYANFDINGVWCRICMECYRTREGYYDLGQARDLTRDFRKLREEIGEVSILKEIKLTQRVKTLIDGFQEIDESYSNSITANFLKLTKSSQRKSKFEKSLVPWEDETDITNCPHCLQGFNFVLRKHHCRLCGIVICGDNMTNCSKMFNVGELAKLIRYGRKVTDENYGVLICKGCSGVLAHVKQQDISIGDDDDDVHDHDEKRNVLIKKLEALMNIRRAIELNLPRLEQTLQFVKSSKPEFQQEELQKLDKLRKRITTTLKQYDTTMKEILALKPQTPDQQSIQRNVRVSASQFLHEATSVLKTLPKMLKEIESKSSTSTSTATPTPTATPPPPPVTSLTKGVYGSPPPPSQPQYIPSKRQITRAQAASIRSHRQELMVLKEQVFLIQKMIDDKTKERKFDEVGLLKGNLEELNKEVTKLMGILSDLGEEGF